MGGGGSEIYGEAERPGEGSPGAAYGHTGEGRLGKLAPSAFKGRDCMRARGHLWKY